MLTKRQTEILRAMVAAADCGSHESAEIVCENGKCWLGYGQVSRRTVDGLLSVCAISLASEPGSLERYAVTGTGRLIERDPAVADRVMGALLSGGSFDAGGNPV